MYFIKTNPLEFSGTTGTLQGFIFVLIFFFFNQRQLDACDEEAFTKVTFLSEKLYNQ